MIILTGGQTGVDRGAWRAARDLAVDRGGYMPSDARDEVGDIPPEIARELKRCRRPGYPARTGMNVSRATGVLVIVKDRQQPYATPGTRITLLTARAAGVPRATVDEGTPIRVTLMWLRGRAGTDLLVAGPRASLWPDGERVAYEFVTALLTAAQR